MKLTQREAKLATRLPLSGFSLLKSPEVRTIQVVFQVYLFHPGIWPQVASRPPSRHEKQPVSRAGESNPPLRAGLNLYLLPASPNAERAETLY